MIKLSGVSLRTSTVGCLLAALLAQVMIQGTVQNAYSQSLDDARANGLTIAIANEPPLALLGADGAPTGAGPDLDKAILGEAGIRNFSGQIMEYGAMIPAIQSKRASFASAGSLVIKPERCEAVNFSEPVHCMSEAFIVRIDLADKVKTYKDIADQGLTMGVCGDCAMQQSAIKAGVPSDKIVVYPDGTSAIKLLAEKRIDVLSHDSISAGDLLKRLGDPATMKYVRVAEAPLLCAGAAFNKDDPELLQAYNDGLTKIRASGEYLEILERYGLEDAANGVEKYTMAQLCGK